MTHVQERQNSLGKLWYSVIALDLLCTFLLKICNQIIIFDKQKPQEFIENVKEITNMQFRNEDRAVFGKGPYKLRKGLKKYYVNDFEWGQLTAQ